MKQIWTTISEGARSETKRSLSSPTAAGRTVGIDWTSMLSNDGVLNGVATILDLYSSRRGGQR
jgi:phosphoribosylaminoimidazole (AIR) synthetase